VTRSPRKHTDNSAGRAHECGPACPGPSGVVAPSAARSTTEAERRGAYEFHRADLEAALARQLAQEKLWAKSDRPDWYWAYADRAAPLRDHPERYERPWMHEPVRRAAAVDPGWVPGAEPSISAPEGETLTRPTDPTPELARLLFLAASGELTDWEATQIMSRCGGYDKLDARRARAVREGLAMRPRPTSSA